MSGLSDRLQAANVSGLSARAIAKQARLDGFTLNHDTAARYLRGDHGRPDEDTLRAFASVLAVELTELRRAAELPTEETAAYHPPPESARLSRRQRRAVDEIIRAMLEGAPVGESAQERARRSDRNDRDRPVLNPGRSRAARRGEPEPPVG